ncbi:beta strand repeat-containing protein, partial [Pseudacidovorax intermedius]|uniref:beta strand repeat-containing protein n=1 Tax=Pseudacidovorax intermedius TaxID=433924 RepID=UPI001B868915
MATFGGASGGTVTVSGTQSMGGLTFNTTGYTLTSATGLGTTGGLTFSGASTVTTPSSKTATLQAPLNGAGSLLFTGGGTTNVIQQSGNLNNFSGGVTVNAGTVTLQTFNNCGSGGSGLGTGPISVANGATLDLQAAGSSNHLGCYVTAPSTSASSVSVAGTLKLDALTTLHMPPLTLSGGVLATYGTLNTTWGTYVLDHGVTVSADSTISAVNVNNTASGGTPYTVPSGTTLNVTGYFGKGTSGPDTGFSLSGGGRIIFSGSDNTGSGAITVSAGDIQVGAGGTTGSIDSHAGIALSNTNASLTFNRSNAYASSKVISGAGKLFQTGTGTTTLTAANTYSGDTTVSAGTLAVGVTNAVPIASAVKVTGGTFSLGSFSQTLSAGLTVTGGTLDMGSGGALILSGGTSNVSAITGSGSITVNTGAVLNLTAGISASNVNIVMAGGTLNLGTFTHSFGTLTQTNSSTIGFGAGSSLTVASIGSLGTSKTLTASGWVAGSTHFYATAVTGTPARNTANLVPLNQIKLDVNAASLTYWASGTPGELLAAVTPGSLGYTYWDTTPGNGTIDGGTGTWDNSQLMWTDNTGASNSTWVAGSIATFQGTAGTVTVSGTQFIKGLNFNVDGYVLTGGTLSLNANSTFVLSGSGITATLASPLSGTFGMTFAGGTTIIKATTAATGVITVTGSGTLQVGDGGTLGDIGAVDKVTLDTDSRLVFNRSDTYTFNKQIANAAVGVGTVVQQGSGTTVLGHTPNGWAVDTLVNNGTLRYGVAGAIPTATPVTVAAGATLDVNGLSVSRSGTTSISGTLALGTGGNVDFTGGSHSIAAITGSGIITLRSGASLTLTGNITNSGVDIVLAGGSLNLAGGTTSSLGKLSQSAASIVNLSGSGNASLSVSNLDPGSFALAVTNWTNGADHLYATAVAGSPSRNTSNIAPLNQISLDGNSASRTYWASGTNELLLGAAASYTYWDTSAGNNLVDGGTGNWDTTSGNWSDSSGNFNGTWAAGSIANFQGSA